MTVRENITYGMKVRGINRQERDKEADKAASILGIEELLERRPKNLSGGQRQRVAIGRAIVRDPQFFLFDEPLSNLDAKLRISMRAEIKDLHRRLKNTIVYVTHDQVEAMTLADRVVVMNNGLIEQIGEPLELYEQPANLFVAGFIGSPSMNFFKVKVVKNDGQISLQFNNGNKIPVADKYLKKCEPLIDQECTFGLRPEHFTGGNTNPATIDIMVKVIEPIGQFTLLVSDFSGEEMTIQVDPRFKVKVDELTTVTLDMKKMHLFDMETEQSLL
jgi:multiple sugar transport system ATP-binding protein